MTLRENIKISIIIPVYNRESYIGGCLDSVLRQTILEKEIICIDDGSDDATLDVMNDYASKYENIVVLKQEHAGVSAARNYGIREARGEYIAFMDSDDWYPEDDVLEYMYDKAKEYQLPLVGGGIAHIADDNPTAQHVTGNPYSVFKKEEVVSLSEEQVIGGFVRYLYQRDFLLKNNIWFPSVATFEDAYFIFYSKLQAKKYLKLTKIVYAYRISYKHDTITPDRTLESANIFVKIAKLAKENDLEGIQQQVYSRLEAMPFYKYVALLKGDYKKNLHELWKSSLFNDETTKKMILSENDIDDVIRNGKIYEDQYISDIRKFSNCVVYGYWGPTKFLIRYLRSIGINVSCICVSKGYLSQKNVGDIQMQEVDGLVDMIDPDDTFFLISAHSFSHKAIQRNLESFGCKNYKIVDFRKLQLFPHALDIDFVWS